MRWSASLKRPARAFGSSSNLRPLGKVRRTTFEEFVMAMMLIALLAVFLPALQTETSQTATMQSDVDRLVRAAEGLAGTGLTHDDRHLRGNVAFVLGRLGDPRGFETIAAILADRYYA